MPGSLRALYVVGPSSTGKTTLCEKVADYLALSPPMYIKEVARDVMRKTGYSRHTVGQLAMQHAIMLAQIKAEQEARQAALGSLGIILSDRSAVDPIVYSSLHDATEGKKNTYSLISSAEFQKILPFYRQSSFLLLKPIPEWLIDDGVRLLDDQEESWMAFQEVLTQLRIPFWQLDEKCRSLEERVKSVLEVLKP